MAGDGRNRRVALEHSLLGDPEVAAAPAPGDAWPLGRDERGNEILVLPIRRPAPGLCRVSSRQSGLGRALIVSDGLNVLS